MMNHWTFRCRDVSEMISRSMDTRLPLGKRIGIRFHLMMCRLCRRYQQQLALISDALSSVDKALEAEEPDSFFIVPLPDDVKKDIQTRLG